MNFQILYGAYVRPLLEYANQVVYSGCTKDVTLSERVQRAPLECVSIRESVNLPFYCRFIATTIVSRFVYRRGPDTSDAHNSPDIEFKVWGTPTIHSNQVAEPHDALERTEGLKSTVDKRTEVWSTERI
ncbi:hypothetical protein T265_04912 [Opisthorchis viverrini]|uniref:Uncharacterized protein n=1 Tax=Opisthorchis viverrini TaxID=6198 RepID=A0A075AG01_OPIVI|nr:hypothetical protein T265_04912 [Opisthorchis viverrini]KER28239.1 hypothetical protein T265_04912 [Opisthorchis viverrini]